jgi:hypothetical protein
MSHFMSALINDLEPTFCQQHGASCFLLLIGDQAGACTRGCRGAWL